MNLWLDDMRAMPSGFDIHTKSVGEAIRALTEHEITFASLDYDVIWDPGGDAEDWENTRTGFAVVEWMRVNHAWPKEGVAVHSANPIGGPRMKAVIEAHYGIGSCDRFRYSVR